MAALTSSLLFSQVTRYQLVFVLALRAAQSSKQSNSGRAELTLQQCPLCPGLTLYLPACSLIPCQGKPLCWVTVLVAKQSALVFNILQSACIGLAVSQGAHTHTHTHTDWGPTLLIPLALMREGYVDYVCWGLPVRRIWRRDNCLTWKRWKINHSLSPLSSARFHSNAVSHTITFHSHLHVGSDRRTVCLDCGAVSNLVWEPTFLFSNSRSTDVGPVSYKLRRVPLACRNRAGGHVDDEDMKRMKSRRQDLWSALHI